MAIDSVAAFMAEVRQSQLLEAAQMEELNRESRSFQAPLALAKHLLKKNLLTPFQVNTLMQGQGGSLAMGQYRLLERLGEGGMGQVYKARHMAMGRIVALKVIKKDKLTNEAAVKRFHREIQAAATLTHPNVVLAFDADRAGATHFIAMEYVDGIDVSKLVKEQGAQSVALACDIIRQAALGLHHAFERGLVHRDIKPGNLLITRSGEANGEPRKAGDSGVLRRRGKLQVKILDMGLARIAIDAEEESSQVSHDGTVVGTPDFMAPEQAKNSHQVDHRADIYSLGCTFYYLLAGQVPFPGGSNIEKLLKHQMDTPRPIEQLRPDVPEGVRAVLRRMMAKRADDRPQTAGEVAAMLQNFCDPSVVRQAAPAGGGLPVAQVVGKARPGTLPAAHVVSSTSTRAGSQTRQETIPVFRNLLKGTWRKRPRSRRGWLALGILLLVLLLGVWLIPRFMSGPTTPVRGSQTLSTSPVAVGPSTQPAPTAPVPPPTAKLPPEKLPVAAVPLRHLPETAHAAVVFRAQDIRQSRFYNNYRQLFNPEITPFKNMLEFGLGVDLAVEVERVVLVFGDNDEDTWLVYGGFERRRFQDAMVNRQGRARRVPMTKGLEYYETPDQGRTHYVALIGSSVVVQTPNQKTIINILERNAGLRAPEFKDPELARLISDWNNLPSIAILVGGTTQLEGGKTYESAGLRNLTLGLQVADDVQVRLAIGTKSSEDADRYKNRLADFLSAYTTDSNGYSLLLKRFLGGTPTVDRDHNIILQATYTAQEVASYFRKKPLNE